MSLTGFSLTEVIVSLVLVAVTLVGLANLFIAGKRHTLHARSRITGVELGKAFLDPLQMDVRQDTWGLAANCLTNPSVGACPPAQAFDSITYTPTYISDNVPGTSLLRVKLTVSWNEPAP